MNLGCTPRLNKTGLLFKECRRGLRYAVYKIGRNECNDQKGFGEKIGIHELRGSFSKKDSPFILNCGYGFSFICGLGTNDLFSEGVNFHGQLGTGYRAYIPFQGNHEAYSDNLAEVCLPGGSEGEAVLGVACGRAHSVVITKSSIFAMGLNTLGQCAASSKDHVLAFPRKVQLPSHAGRPKKVCCGFDHTVLLTDQGQVFTSGLGTDGQTGLSSFGCHYELKEVQFPVECGRILNIAAGADNSLALTESGHLFGWGNNEYRQISSAVEEDQICVPLMIPFDPDEDIVDLQCGGTFTALQTVKGRLFVKGFTIFSNQRNVKNDQEFNLLYLDLPFSLRSAKCGTDYIAVKAEKSNLLTLGFRERVALRRELDTRENSTSYGLLTLAGEIIDFACGVDHILALVEIK